MVEILCPHCEEEIELEDDASGEFACPYCDGEFECNIDTTSEEVDSEMFGQPAGGGAALRWTMGLIFTLVGFGFMLVSLVGVFLGSEVAGAESDIGLGTGLGAGVIVLSLLIGVFGLALTIAGIGAIRRNFAAFVACTVLSVLGGLGAIGQTIDSRFQIDAIMNLLFWAAMIAGHMFVMFNPRGRMMWME